MKVKCERVGAYPPTRFRLNSIKHAFVQFVGMCAFVYIAVVLLVEDTVRNMPPLAFGIPMNNTVKDGFIICGLFLSYGDYNKRALSLSRDSR